MSGACLGQGAIPSVGGAQYDQRQHLDGQHQRGLRRRLETTLPEGEKPHGAAGNESDEARPGQDEAGQPDEELSADGDEHGDGEGAQRVEHEQRSDGGYVSVAVAIQAPVDPSAGGEEAGSGEGQGGGQAGSARQGGFHGSS
jgi:hypothetical protein